MRGEDLRFDGALGHALAARLDLPEGSGEIERGLVVFAHCFTCSKRSLAASRISRALVARGFGALRFDFTGLGDSDGAFHDTDFSSNVGDLIRAVRHARARLGGALPVILVGHSLGGAAALVAARELPEVLAVATIGAPFDPGHVTHLFKERLDEIAAEGSAEVDIGGRPFRVSKRFLDDVAEQPTRAAIASLRRPLLVLHAPTDEVVAVEHAERIFAAARHPRSLIALDDADHLLTRREDADYAAGLLSAWIARYLPEKTGEARVDAGRAPVEGVRVRELAGGRYTQEVLAGRHRLIADEPASVGGDDRGPGPYEYLLAALGACTSMTLRMYAERKSWPLEQVDVQLRHAKVHRDDCEGCSESERKLDELRRAITLRGPLDDEQRRRLLEIADRCPVHRTLHSEVRVITTVTEPDEG